jgi:hypothetical protein
VSKDRDRKKKDKAARHRALEKKLADKRDDEKWDRHDRQHAAVEEWLLEEVRHKMRAYGRGILYLPEGEGARLVQDALACNFEEHEYRNIGLLIKFAGYFGTPIQFTGKNRETLTDAPPLPEKEAALREEVESALPAFAKTVAKATEEGRSKGCSGHVMMHQDSFAADYQEHEFILLGKAVKYCGVFGVTIEFVGTNGSTIEYDPALDANDKQVARQDKALGEIVISRGGKRIPMIRE